MAIVVKWLTHLIVVQTFEGSIPFSRPIIIFYDKHDMAIVVKWLTHLIVVQTFEGSIPFSRPIL